MKRFYGTAVFEGEEVADSAFTRLQDIRAEEVRRVEYHNREFQMQIEELNIWRINELASINLDAHTQINEQTQQINQCNQRIIQIKSSLAISIAAIQAKSFLQFRIRQTQAENDAIASITAIASSQINEQKASIRRCHHEISRIDADRHRAIANVHRNYAIEYNIRLRRRDKDIAWSHAEATDKIAAVLAKRYYLPVFMMRCAKGPCEYCRAKYGTTGTYDELDKLDCVPPFHDDCRCWLEEVGYVVMSR